MRHLGMAVGAGVLADHLAIVIEAQPVETAQDRIGGFRGRTRAVGVFDAQQKLAATAAGEQPVEQRGARAPPM